MTLSILTSPLPPSLLFSLLRRWLLRPLPLPPRSGRLVCSHPPTEPRTRPCLLIARFRHLDLRSPIWTRMNECKIAESESERAEDKGERRHVADRQDEGEMFWLRLTSLFIFSLSATTARDFAAHNRKGREEKGKPQRCSLRQMISKKMPGTACRLTFSNEFVPLSAVGLLLPPGAPADA